MNYKHASKHRTVRIRPHAHFCSIDGRKTVEESGCSILTLFLADMQDGDARVDEEKMAVFLQHVRVYRLKSEENTTESYNESPSDRRNYTNKDIFGDVNCHPKDAVAQLHHARTRSINGAFSPDNSIKTPVKTEAGSSPKKRGHHRNWSNFTEGRETDRNIPDVSLQVVAFGYRKIYFEVSEPICLVGLMNLWPSEKMTFKQFRDRLLHILLRFSNPLIPLTKEISHIWRKFVNSHLNHIIAALEDLTVDPRQEIINYYKHFIIKSSFVELTHERGTTQDLLSSLISLEECESQMKTVKRLVVNSTFPMKEVCESLLIGLFASISNDTARKERFYSQQGEKAPVLDYDSLLDMTLNFLISEFNLIHGTNVTLDYFLIQLRSMHDYKVLDMFKQTGNIEMLHRHLFPSTNPIEFSASKPGPVRVYKIAQGGTPKSKQTIDQTSQAKKELGAEKAISLNNIECSTPTPKLDQSSPRVAKKMGSGYLAQPNTSRRDLSEQGRLSRSRYSNINSEKGSVEKKGMSTTSNHMMMPRRSATLHQKKLHESVRLVEDLTSERDDDIYASFFDENWYVLRNDIKEMLYFIADRCDLARDPIQEEQLVRLIKDENPWLLSALVKRYLGRIDDTKLRHVFFREIRHPGMPDMFSPRDRANREFHYEIFKAILSCLTTEQILAYQRNLKYLFVHEDKFILGAYEFVMLSLFIQPRSPDPTMYLREFEESLELMISVILDKAGTFILAAGNRTRATRSAEDDKAVINEFKDQLTSKELTMLQKTLSFNNSGLLHNLKYRYKREEITKAEFLQRIRKYASMYFEETEG